MWYRGIAALIFHSDSVSFQTQVRSQMEVLLEACSGRETDSFVAVTWEAIAARLDADERSNNSSQECNDDDDGGWEEQKGDVDQEDEKRCLSSGARRGRAGVACGVDVARAASGESQLHVAGTFRRAIRAAVRTVHAVN